MTPVRGRSLDPRQAVHPNAGWYLWLKPVGGFEFFNSRGGGSRRSFSIRGGVVGGVFQFEEGGSRRSFSIRGGGG